MDIKVKVMACKIAQELISQVKIQACNSIVNKIYKRDINELQASI